jgi:WD40 repeat protein
VRLLVGALVFEAESGDLVDRYDLGHCGGWVAGVSETHLLVRTLHGPPGVVDSCRWVDGTWAVELVDRQTRERTALSSELHGWWGTAMSRDGHYVAFDDAASGEVVVVEVATGERVLSFDGGGVRDLNRDGSLLLYGDDPIEVRDLVTGEVASSFGSHSGGSLFARFDPSGRTVFSTGRDGVLREWDARSGEEVFAHPGLETIALLDTRVRGEIGAAETCAGFVWDDGLAIVDGLAIFNADCGEDEHGTTYVMDLERYDVTHALPGHQTRGLAVSPAGTRFVRQEGDGIQGGPLVVRDLSTGEEVVELDSSTLSDIWSHRLRWSPDGSMIAAAFDTMVAVWDATSGALLFAEPPDVDRLHTVDLVFSSDSTRLVTSSANWVVRAISTESWEPLVERDLIMVDGGYALGWVGQTSDGSLLAAGAFLGNTAGALHWFDPETLDVTRRHPNAHDGSIKAMALHEDGSYAATGSSDGFVRVWDTATGDLIHEIPFGDTQVQGVAFVDDQRLAVTLEEGNLLIVTTDVDELLDLVRSTLTRGFTATECAKFGFDDNCPTLVDLRGPLPDTDDPSVLNGRFRVEWTEDELTAEWMAVGDAEEFAREAAAFDAGLIEVTFADGRFDVVKTQEGPTRLCTGSYSVRGDRAWLIAEHDGICDGRVKMFDATFTLADDALHFDNLRGHLSEQIIFASRPLHKIE